MDSFVVTSESVTEGHPDKVADQVSDAVLDAILAEDPNARVACECLVTGGTMIVAGEISTSAYAPIADLARQTIRAIGYTAETGFDPETLSVLVTVVEQSPDIAQGVDDAYEHQRDPKDQDPLDLTGAGDQGMMYGYATDETPELMPLPIMLAHKVCRRLAQVRKAGVIPYLYPDGKAQVAVRYELDREGHPRPAAIERVLVSTQHKEGVDCETLIRPDVIKHVLRPVLPRELYDEQRLEERARPGQEFVLVNPTGKFVHGGPVADTGLTGRKIIVDSYGGAAKHGGGAFSGKDPTKVDRSGAYMARYVAKNLVAAGLAKRVEVGLSYAIGVAHPFSVTVEAFGTAKEGLTHERLVALVREHFDLRPGAIIEALDLRRPIYTSTACYGHFGREEAGFTWERTDRADELREAAKALQLSGVAGEAGSVVSAPRTPKTQPER